MPTMNDTLWSIDAQRYCITNESSWMLDGETCSSKGQRFVTSSYGGIGCPFRVVAPLYKAHAHFIYRSLLLSLLLFHGIPLPLGSGSVVDDDVRRQKQQQQPKHKSQKSKTAEKSSRQICSSSSSNPKEEKKDICIYLKRKKRKGPPPSILRRTRESERATRWSGRGRGRTRSPSSSYPHPSIS